jgi:threonine dehydrogenase-like Zn-dependent dehydrogenase
MALESVLLLRGAADEPKSAAAWDEAGALELVDLPLPEAAPGSVLVRVSAVGICGSDLHCYRRKVHAIAGLVPRHEIGGELVDPGGCGLPAGAPVAVEPLLTCGTCPPLPLWRRTTAVESERCSG